MAIFIDANVPIYAAGRAHSLKEPCLKILDLVAEVPDAFLTDAEVFQELLHRYLALRSWSQGREVFHLFAQVMAGRVESVHLKDVERAADLANGNLSLSARDLLHAAIMNRLGVDQVITADRGFDGLHWVQRLHPAEFETWRETALG